VNLTELPDPVKERSGAGGSPAAGAGRPYPLDALSDPG
jgi:hypothetical protein